MNPWIERLGWTLVHSLWQFAVIALVAAAALRAWRLHDASLRHCWLVVALAAIALAPVATWLMLTPSGSTSSFAAAGLDRSTADSTADSNDATEDGGARVGDADLPPALDRGSTNGDSSHGDLPSVRGGEAISRATRDTSLASSTSDSQSTRSASAWARAEVSWAKRLAWGLRPWLGWIVVAWGCGAALGALRPIFGWWTLRRLKVVGIASVSRELELSAARVARRLGVRRAVAVWQSTLARAPIVAGYFKPVVLLPASFVTSIPAAQLEAILAHELAHVRRHDFLVNLAQTLLETLFFYHPAVWWLSGRLRVEREHCCDDLVVRLFDNRIAYGRALVAVEELRGSGPTLALGAKDGSLVGRIRRLATGATGSLPPSTGRWPVALATFLIALTAFVTWHALAVSLSAEPPGAPLVANFENGPRVELLAVGTHQIRPQIWWTGRGGELKQRPRDPVARQVTFSSATHDDNQAACRELVFRVSGIPANETLYLTYQWIFAGSASFAHRAVVRGSTEFTIGTSPPVRADGLAPKVATVRIGLDEVPEMFVVAIGTDGRKVPQEIHQDELRRLDERVRPLRVAEQDGQAELTLERADRSSAPFIVEYPPLAIDRAGEAHELVRTEGDERQATWLYPLPLAQVARFEVRFRQYRHHAIFHKISLHPGESSDASVSATTPQVVLAPSQDQSVSDANEALLREIDSAPLATCRKLIEKLDAEQRDAPRRDELAGRAALARERLAERLGRIARQPREAFTRELPPGNPLDVNFGGDRIGIQVDLDGVWSEGKGNRDSWRDWIERKQESYRAERLNLLFEAARGYREVDKRQAAERALRAGLSGHEIFDAPWPALVRKYWPVTSDEPAKSLGSGPAAWTLVNFLTELSATQQALGRRDEALATQARLSLAQFMLAWNQPSAGPTQAAREWWRLERRTAVEANESAMSSAARTERLANLIWFNLLDEQNPKRTLDLTGAGERGNPLTYHHANVAAPPTLDFRELKISAEMRGGKGFLDCYRINAEGKHESLGRIEAGADKEPRTVTHSIQIPPETGVVQFMVAGDALRVGQVSVEATFTRRPKDSP